MVKRNSIEKQVAESSKSDDFSTLENIPESRRKIIMPNEFFSENIVGTKFEKSHFSWKKTYLAGGEF